MSAALTEQAAELAVDGACRELRLPTVRAQHAELADWAAEPHWVSWRLDR